MSTTVEESEQPSSGQPVMIVHGPLKGIEGTFSAYRGNRLVIELASLGPGIFAVVDPTCCEFSGDSF